MAACTKTSANDVKGFQKLERPCSSASLLIPRNTELQSLALQRISAYLPKITRSIIVRSQPSQFALQDELKTPTVDSGKSVRRWRQYDRGGAPLRVSIFGVGWKRKLWI